MSNKFNPNAQEPFEREIPQVEKKVEVAKEFFADETPIEESSHKETPVEVAPAEKPIEEKPIEEKLVEERREIKKEQRKEVIKPVAKKRYKVILITRDGCIAQDNTGANKSFYGAAYLQKKNGDEFEE